MWKFVAGVFAGAVLGAGFATWLQPNEPQPDAIMVSRAPLKNPAAALAKGQTPTPASAVAPSPAPAPAPAPQADASATASPLPSGPLPAFQKIPVSESAQKILDANRSAEPDPGYITITTLHDQLEQEPQDASWAYYGEASLRQFFANAAPDLVLGSVVCRQTLCEVAATSANPIVPATWNRVQSVAGEQPWARDLRLHFIATGANDLIAMFQRVAQ